MKSTRTVDWHLILLVFFTIFAVAGTLYTMAPTFASGWPEIDQEAIIWVARDMTFWLGLEALAFWSFMSWIYIYGGKIRHHNAIERLLPVVAVGIFLAKPLLLFHQPTFMMIYEQSSWECFPACQADDQFCVFFAMGCADAPGAVILILFRILPFVMILASFVAALRNRIRPKDAFS